MHRICLFFVGIFLSLAGGSQNFDYELTKDSTAWQELSSQTILNSGNSAWSFSYSIPIGFSFTYLGQDFDSVDVETNGFLVFGHNRSYAFAAFNGFGDKIDDQGNHSVLGFRLDGESGNHILKIQFKNLGQNLSGEKSLSYQVWLYEAADKIQIHIGTNTFRNHENAYELTFDEDHHVDSVLTPLSDSVATLVGLLNMNMNTSTRGLLLAGSLENLYAQPVDGDLPELVHLMIIPRPGHRYTFRPAN
jgi:hypothetical protein